MCVLLDRLGRLVGPNLGHALARLDRRLLVIRVALFGRGYQRRIDDLSAYNQIASAAELSVEDGKQVIHQPGPDQMLTEGLNRVSVRRGRAQIETQKAKPTQAMADQELHPLVVHRVSGGEDHNLEHGHVIVIRSAALSAVRIVQRFLKRCPKHLEVDNLRQNRQRIAG